MTKRDREQPGQHNMQSIVSAILSSGMMVEMVHRPETRETNLCVWNGDRSWYERELVVGGVRLAPYAPTNNLLRHGVVLLPSEATEYESQAELVEGIQGFIHRYVDLPPQFAAIASYYVLLTWIYDAFNEVPYLRVRGDFGTGKTRFLLTVGSLCYKPIFASGASTVSPLFRIIDAFRGTLVLDESDFRLSDERAQIVKILNNGNARGFPVLRTEVTPKRELDPRAYEVFGPKIIATRGFFEDRALESRCLTHEFGPGRLRRDIPINLPDAFKTEARALRNKLLTFRFRHRGTARIMTDVLDRDVEPRLSQVFGPLISVVDDADARAELQVMAREYSRQLVVDRGQSIEAEVLEVIRERLGIAQAGSISIKHVTAGFVERFGQEYDQRITNRWIGTIMRTKLQLRPQKSHGIYVLPPSELPKLQALFERFGVEPVQDALECVSERPGGP